ncbi:RING finger and SPRY domain-containing protein 1 [Entomophthora muscae]|nr:RING finger and SPRY domain-containing protein 1 [Entomophthora muscae]
MVCWFFQETFSHGCAKWVPGDIVGCYLNLSNWSAIFYINGRAISAPIQLPPDDMDRFINQEGGFRPAISLTVYEHVKVNFGGRPFKFSPPEGYYRDMNQYGSLDEKFRAGPRSQLTGPGTVFGETALSAEEEDSMCQLCCTNEKNIVILPCQHDGICGECVSKLNTCPFCREAVRSWYKSCNREAANGITMRDAIPTAASSVASLSSYHDALSTPTALAPSAC